MTTEKAPTALEAYENEFEINKVVEHGTDDGVVQYYGRWYGYLRERETFEPIEPLPRSKFLQYHRRARTPVPITLDRAKVR